MRWRFGMTLFELVVSLTIILIFAGILLGFIFRASLIARQTALRYELNNIRFLIDIHRQLEGRYPEDLKIFLQTPYDLGTSDKIIFGKKFVHTISYDRQGYPVDPFGRRLFYDAKKGVVRSITREYENW